MAEVSNNLIAGLLLIAIVISGLSVYATLGFLRGPPVTGGAITDQGSANITIQGQVSIELITNRDVVDFDSGALDGARRELTTISDNYGNFDDGGYGNGSTGNDVWGTCDNTEGNCAFPLVVRNNGNLNCTLNITLTEDAVTFIGGNGPGMFIMGQENETSACGQNFTTGDRRGSWINVTTATEVEICSQFDFNPSSDEIRVHWNLSVPSDASGTKGQVVTLGAVTP
jgi:hypothetical protein